MGGAQSDARQGRGGMWVQLRCGRGRARSCWHERRSISARLEVSISEITRSIAWSAEPSGGVGDGAERAEASGSSAVPADLRIERQMVWVMAWRGWGWGQLGEYVGMIRPRARRLRHLRVGDLRKR